MGNIKKILIRVDGHKYIGMGHIYRTITLAEYLREYYGLEIIFITRNNKGALDLIREKKIKVNPLPFMAPKKEEMRHLRNTLNKENPSLVIVDLLGSDLDNSYMGCFKKTNQKITLVAFTDDPKKRIINADIVFSSDPDQHSGLYKNVPQAKYYLGFNFAILKKEYANKKSIKKIKKNIKEVLVCMGGADRHNLTLKVLASLDRSSHQFKATVIINSTFFYIKEIDNFINKLYHHVDVYYDVDSLYGYLLNSDIAVTAGGIAHLERMCLGIPGIVINQSLRQADISKRIMAKGATLDLGLYSEVSESEILNSFNALIEDWNWRKRISENSRRMIDGKGLMRIARIINNAINTN